MAADKHLTGTASSPLAGPDGKKAARFRCRCGKRNVTREKFLRYFIVVLLSITSLASCVTVPIPAKGQASRCEISTDRLTLKVIDIAEETNSYYSVEGYFVSPILVPTTAILSGAYVLAHNTYRFGEEKIVCG